MAIDVGVTFDCTDPRALSIFWAEVLGYELAVPPPPFQTWDEALDAWGVAPELRNERSVIVDPDGHGPRLLFQRVPEPKTSKNRMHLDLRAAPGLSEQERMAQLEVECARLLDLGATRVERFEPSPAMGEQGFIVMQDPEGNEFCLD